MQNRLFDARERAVPVSLLLKDVIIQIISVFVIDNLYGELHLMKHVLHEKLRSQQCLFFCNWIFTSGLEKTMFIGQQTNRALCCLMISQKVNGLICCFVLKENLNSPHGKGHFIITHSTSSLIQSCLKLIFKTCITSKLRRKETEENKQTKDRND